jgi:hypothetical protein
MTHTHSVSFRRLGRDEWCEQAAFVLHKDALQYAAWLSTQIARDTIVRVSGGRNYVDVYYAKGAEIVDDEAMA